MTSDERAKFFNAVKEIMKAPPNGGASKYDTLVKCHIDAQDFAHGNDNFFTWHRAYLRTFEIELQKIDATVCLPYWNWSLDSQAPEACAVFTDDYCGGNGNSDDNCVTKGTFGGWKPFYPQPHCLKRKYAYGDNLGSYHSSEGINRMVTSCDKYADLRDQMENGFHGGVHVSIGGDMEEMHSPNDPLFWLHHGYVDYVWAIWQGRKGLEFSGTAKDGTKLDKSTKCLGLNYSIGDVLDYRQLCYKYENIDPGVLAPPPMPKPTIDIKKPDIVPVPQDDSSHNCSDRSSLSDLRYPQPLSDKFCQMNGLKQDAIAKCKQDYEDNCYKKLNNLKGFVSPCALIKRPDLCKPYVQPGKEVYIDVAGLGRIKYNPVSQEATQVVANCDAVVREAAPDYDKADTKAVEQIVGAQAFNDSAANANLASTSPAEPVKVGVALIAAVVGWVLY